MTGYFKASLILMFLALPTMASAEFYQYCQTDRNAYFKYKNLGDANYKLIFAADGEIFSQIDAELHGLKNLENGATYEGVNIFRSLAILAGKEMVNVTLYYFREKGSGGLLRRIFFGNSSDGEKLAFEYTVNGFQPRGSQSTCEVFPYRDIANEVNMCNSGRLGQGFIKNMDILCDRIPKSVFEGHESLSWAGDNTSFKINDDDLNYTFFENFKDIVNIALPGNELTKVPAFIKSLKNLRYLDLSSNKLTKINTDAFQSNAKLLKIDLSGNHIAEIEANAFRGLEVLTINLLHNPLTKVSRSLLGIDDHTSVYGVQQEP
jgi:hypothetical protein